MEQLRLDREFLCLARAFKSAPPAVDDLVMDDDLDLTMPMRSGGVLGALLAAAIVTGLVGSGQPWWVVLAFVVYGAPAAVLVWMTATAGLARRLRRLGVPRRAAAGSSGHGSTTPARADIPANESLRRTS